MRSGNMCVPAALHEVRGEEAEREDEKRGGTGRTRRRAPNMHLRPGGDRTAAETYVVRTSARISQACAGSSFPHGAPGAAPAAGVECRAKRSARNPRVPPAAYSKLLVSQGGVASVKTRRGQPPPAPSPAPSGRECVPGPPGNPADASRPTPLGIPKGVGVG